MWKWPVVFSLLLQASAAFSQITDRERQGLTDTLSVGNLIPADLRFERKPFYDKYRMDIVDFALDDPLRIADTVMGWHSAGLADPGPNLISLICRSMYGEPPAVPKISGEARFDATSKIDPKLRPIISELVLAVQFADTEIRTATNSLTALERREVIEGLPVLAVEEPKVKFAFVKQSNVKLDRLLGLLTKVNLVKVREASQTLWQKSLDVKAKLRAANVIQNGLIREKVNGLLIEIGGSDDTVFTTSDTRITIDLGGNDTYRGRCGAGVGYSSVLIDLDGNDVFHVGDLSCGASILGVGIALVDGGNDHFESNSIAFGSGLAGVGVFAKSGGNDTYQSVSLAQGYGQFGIGLCIDSGGNDTYKLQLFGQGASRTQGVGWLMDTNGSDSYQAGGLSMNEPLFSGISYSYAQGFSSGYREDTGGVSGGIGLLTDGNGRDFYIGDTYLQASSYWFGLGSLYDASGNDSYTGYHYCQSSAMHCSVAYLFDLDGNDSYLAQVGASLAIGHDYGVAMLLDRAGDDIYVSKDSNPGLGVANGLGIFVDADGSDRYGGPPGQGNAARGTGSLGIFVDIGGEDKYGQGFTNGDATYGSNWGIAYDFESKMVDTPPIATIPKVGSVPVPNVQELERIYRLATAWGVGQSEKSVPENVKKLIEIGVPAWDWMITTHLETCDRLQQRAFVAVAKALGDLANPSAAKTAIQGSLTQKRNLISICSEAGLKSINASLSQWLEIPELQLASAKAAGPLGALECVPGLTKLCLSKDRLLVRSCMISLCQIADSSSVGTAQVMLMSTDFPTRMAALALVLKFPIHAKSIGESMSNESDEQISRTGIRLLASLNTPDALKTIGSFLLDPRPGARIEAMLALNGRCPAEYQSAFSSLAADPVEIVRAVARRCKATKS